VRVGLGVGVFEAADAEAVLAFDEEVADAFVLCGGSWSPLGAIV
jgi:hypothetical protein